MIFVREDHPTFVKERSVWTGNSKLEARWCLLASAQTSVRAIDWLQWKWRIGLFFLLSEPYRTQEKFHNDQSSSLHIKMSRPSFSPDWWILLECKSWRKKKKVFRKRVKPHRRNIATFCFFFLSTAALVRLYIREMEKHLGHAWTN